MSTSAPETATVPIAEGVLYTPVPAEIRGGSAPNYGVVVENREQLERSLAFALELPSETYGQTVAEYRVLGGGSPSSANSAYLVFDDMQIHQEVAASTAAASQRVFDIARGGLAELDDRFMQRVMIHGHEGVVWDAFDVRMPSSEDDGSLRPGVVRPTAGIAWSEGSRVYTIHSFELDGEHLINVAESMR